MTKFVKIIFTLSLLLNLALAGIVVGSLYKKHQWHGPSELGEKSRSVMKENIKKSRQEMRAQFKEIRKQHIELKKIISAAEFDQQAYDQTIEKILDGKDDLARRKAAIMGETLSELSQEERNKMSGHILKNLSSKHKRHQRFDREKSLDRVPPEKR